MQIVLLILLAVLVAGVAALLASAGDGPLSGLRRRLFAALYDRVQEDYEGDLAVHRRDLLAGLTGTVVEIGPGTGANLPHLPAESTWIGVEPSAHMRVRLEARARALGREAAFRGRSASDIDVPAGSADVVVSTLVLCSVPDPAAVLTEVRRILKPGGTFVFLEHVAAPAGSPLRRRQRRLRPFWRLFADGCTPDRETESLIRRAGFAEVECHPFAMPRPPCPEFVSPHLKGYARKAP